jgi:glucose/arabinose dehydrogenase
MAFLPDARLLVTQKAGSLVVVSADGTQISAPITGIPAVDSNGQGGLLDVVLDPQFASNRRVYLTFSEPGPPDAQGRATNGAAVLRGELNANATALANTTVIFRQSPKKGGTSNHYGSRLVFRADGSLFVTLGERAAYPAEAQPLTGQLGKVVRITTDGAPLPDNPFYAEGGAAATVWSFGHRNPQGAALNPATGDLWVAEHGPQGGDEVNLALPGRNFGWPVVSYGCKYGDPVGTACRIGGGVHGAPFTAPLAVWYPVSTAPGALMFYSGRRFPEWKGSLFVGGLAGATLWRLALNGNAVVGVERFFAGQHQIRDLKVGPDGWIYLIARDTHQILRVQR